MNENGKKTRNRIIGIVLFILLSAGVIWLLMQLNSCEGCGKKQEKFGKIEVVETTEVSGEDLNEEEQKESEEAKKPFVSAKNDGIKPTSPTDEGGTQEEETTSEVQSGNDTNQKINLNDLNKPAQPVIDLIRPSKPINPTNPTNSSNPTESTNPINPSNPSQPTNPTNPSKPTEPTNPTNPSKPTEPTRPTDPTKPTEPTRPTEPTKPTEPTRPTEPTKPTEPTTPTEPTKPTEPTRPTEPTKPTEPTRPTEPVKKDPVYTVPKLKAEYGQTYADINDQLPKGWSFEQSLATKVGDAGPQYALATFTPDDTVHFNIVRGIKVEIDVAKATPSYSIPTDLTATFGQKQGEVAAQLAETGFSVENPAADVGNAGDGSIKLTYTPSDNKNYETVSGITAPLQVAKAPIVITGVSLDDDTFPYNPDRSYSIHISGTLPDGVTVTYEGNNRTNQGNWLVRVIFSCDENHKLNITSMTGIMRIWDDPSNPGNGTILQPEAPDVPGSSGVLTPGDSVGQG